MISKKAIVIGTAVVATVAAVGTAVWWLYRDTGAVWEAEWAEEQLDKVDELYKKATEEFPHDKTKRDFTFELEAAEIVRAVAERFKGMPEFDIWVKRYDTKVRAYVKGQQ